MVLLPVWETLQHLKAAGESLETHAESQAGMRVVKILLSSCKSSV